MGKTDLTARAVAAFIDLLIVLGLARLPDIIGFLAAVGYLLFRDGLFEHQSVGKRLIGIRVVSCDDPGKDISFRESIIRNTTLAAAYVLFLVPLAGWVLGTVALAIEGLTAMGDDRGMRVGDIIARTMTVPSAAAPADPDDGGQESGGAPPDET